MDPHSCQGAVRDPGAGFVSLRGPKLDDPKGNFLRSALCQRSSRLFESGRRRTTFPKTAASPRFLEKWCSSVLILTGAFQSSVSPANLWALRSKIAESSILPKPYGRNGFERFFLFVLPLGRDRKSAEKETLKRTSA